MYCTNTSSDCMQPLTLSALGNGTYITVRGDNGGQCKSTWSVVSSSIVVAMAMGRLALKIHLAKIFGSKLGGKVLPSALNLVNWLL